jgi:flagellum-specific ATP synthase
MTKPRILIVEDDRDLRDALVTTLELAKFRVYEAADGHEALRQLSQVPVDMVVSDVNMPGMSGHELLAEVQRLYPGLPMMLMTAYGQISHAVSAMQAGAIDYLVKQFEGHTLVDAVSKITGGKRQAGSDQPVAEDPISKRMFQLAAKVANSDSTVMISGESGTGKEVLARYIHQHSPRANKPFIAINCAAIPENMLEAMLFGHEKGAFTGAIASSPGKFEQASGGTILLDEVSEMDPGLQSKLLRVLQERVGGRKTIALDVRVVDGSGEPLDGKGPLYAEARVSLSGDIINPLNRAPVRQPMDVGIRAINALLTVGQGQRLCLFAGSGVGKSVLLGMMTRFTNADVTVVGLVGERGREVKEFIEDILGEEGLARSVVVASPADDSPLMRLRAAMLTTRIAEFYRDQGKRVLLLMDSLTRYAQAQREIALAVGEPPATKGYPPSVFAKLPQLVERTGNGRPGGGSITAFYTVLTEGDDQQDPIADAARAILDGHIVLSRRLAEEDHYPAIDVEASSSRVMPQVTDPENFARAQRFKQVYSRYQQARDLISVGAYVKGSDPETDFAVAHIANMRQFLKQGLGEKTSLTDSVEQLLAVVPERRSPERTPGVIPNSPASGGNP